MTTIDWAGGNHSIPPTGPIDLLAVDHDEENDGAALSYTLVPRQGEPGAFMAVFADGSYTRWIPQGISL